MLGKLEKDNRVFGGKNGAMTFEKWFEKEVIGYKVINVLLDVFCTAYINKSLINW